MPLPKTASITARATEVYSEVCQLVLERTFDGPTDNKDSLKPTTDRDELPILFPYLRQLLTCCACAGLLEEAMISVSCGHCYCYQCQYREPLLKIQCRQCKERSSLEVEHQLRLLVKCYRELCHSLALSLLKKGKPLAVEEKKKEEKVDVIGEILKEVREGVKVSRSVLVVRPPERYINARQVATPKKEEAFSTTLPSHGKLCLSRKKQKESTHGVQSETRKKIKLANQIVKKRLHFPVARRQQQQATLQQRDHVKQRREDNEWHEDFDDEYLDTHESDSLDPDFIGGTAKLTMDVDLSCLCEIPNPRRTSHLIWLQIPNPHLPPLPTLPPSPLLHSRLSVRVSNHRIPLGGRLSWRRKPSKPSRRKKRRAVPITSPRPLIVPREELSTKVRSVGKNGSGKKGVSTPRPSKSHKLLPKTPHGRPKMDRMIGVLPFTPTARMDFSSPLAPYTPKQFHSAPSSSSSTPTTWQLTAEELRKLRVEPRFRCRCGTNPGIMFVHMVCAKKKCPCFLNEIPCLRCKCRGCYNPYNKLLPSEPAIFSDQVTVREPQTETVTSTTTAAAATATPITITTIAAAGTTTTITTTINTTLPEVVLQITESEL